MFSHYNYHDKIIKAVLKDQEEFLTSNIIYPIYDCDIGGDGIEEPYCDFTICGLTMPEIENDTKKKYVDVQITETETIIRSQNVNRRVFKNLKRKFRKHLEEVDKKITCKSAIELKKLKSKIKALMVEQQGLNTMVNEYTLKLYNKLCTLKKSNFDLAEQLQQIEEELELEKKRNNILAKINKRLVESSVQTSNDCTENKDKKKSGIHNTSNGTKGNNKKEKRRQKKPVRSSVTKPLVDFTDDFKRIVDSTGLTGLNKPPDEELLVTDEPSGSHVESKRIKIKIPSGSRKMIIVKHSGMKHPILITNNSSKDKKFLLSIKSRVANSAVIYVEIG